MRVFASLFGAGLLAVSLAGVACAQGSAAPAADPAAKPKLTVMTYSSFAGKYGPGPKLKAGFETSCGCELVWQANEDAGAMIARLKLEGSSAAADAVVGVDMNLMEDARATALFAPHGLPASGVSLPIAWDDATFAPFDYGWFAFVYDSSKMSAPPQSLAAMAEARDDSLRIVIEDPRSSSVGLGGLLWMRAAFGDQADAMWAKLKPKILTVTKGWSDAYGLFLKGEADMVLSYTTSPAYHLIAEKKTQYKAAPMREGHYLQVETAGVLAGAKQPELARAFLAYLVSPAAQAIIPTSQWMYPVAADTPLSPEFAALARPEKSLTIDPVEVAAKRRAWIDSWLAAISK